MMKLMMLQYFILEKKVKIKNDFNKNCLFDNLIIFLILMFCTQNLVCKVVSKCKINHVNIMNTIKSFIQIIATKSNKIEGN